MPGAMIWRLAGLAGLVLGLGLVVLWATGGLAWVEATAQAGQKRFQTDLARLLRSLSAGEAGALSGLVMVAFGYGVLHAAGPGHGKVVVGGYGVARAVPVLKLALVAVAAALVQATVAVALVIGGGAFLGWGRAQIGAAEAQLFAPVAQILIALIGLWLIWRGARGLYRLARPPCRQGPGLFRAYHAQPAPDACPDCGHRHGPTLQEVSSLTSAREAAFLIAAIGARPCSGALMLLVLTWQIGLLWAGILGAYAMALGTALVTVSTAALAVWARQGGLAGLPVLQRLRPLGPVLELGVGAIVLTYAAVAAGG